MEGHFIRHICLLKVFEHLYTLVPVQNSETYPMDTEE